FNMSWQAKSENSQVMKNDQYQPSYPFIQYINQGATLEPQQPRGGFAISEEQYTELGAYPVGAEMCNLRFRDGTETAVMFATELSIAPLVTRFSWVQDGHRLSDYTPGARGKLQLLTLIQTDEGLVGPVMLTVKGLTSKQLMAGLRQHRKSVKQATDGAAPAAFFTFKIQSGQPRMVGSGTRKSKITPVNFVESAEFNPDAAYIGDQLADFVEAEWETFAEWAAAWDQAGPNGEGEITSTSTADFSDQPLPFASTKYPNGTLQDLVAANDLDALRATVQWCKQHGSDVATVAAEALHVAEHSITATAPF
ncbi:MAG: hypothetical protein U9Q70_07365, partial [Chloroflexota bacterium]|nr:hypothetical protein [Chloroflexota bacterium]